MAIPTLCNTISWCIPCHCLNHSGLPCHAHVVVFSVASLTFAGTVFQCTGITVLQLFSIIHFVVLPNHGFRLCFSTLTVAPYCSCHVVVALRCVAHHAFHVELGSLPVLSSFCLAFVVTMQSLLSLVPLRDLGRSPSFVVVVFCLLFVEVHMTVTHRVTL